MLVGPGLRWGTVGTGAGHGGITCVLQSQFSSLSKEFGEISTLILCVLENLMTCIKLMIL